MKAYLAFTRKEAMECVRTYKCMILFVVFFVLGFMNPITANYMPVLIKSIMPQVDMHLSEPTVMDSWMQFFKNVSQMGIVIYLLMFSGILSREFTKGTLINMVTKGLKRKTILLSKISFLVITLPNISKEHNNTPNSQTQNIEKKRFGRLHCDQNIKP